MALRQNWYLISCKWLRLTAGQSKKYWVFTKQGHARSYQRITKDMTKLEKIKSPKICLESCSCKITGATTISCVFFGLFLVVSDSTTIKHRRGDPPWEGWKPPRPVPAQPLHVESLTAGKEKKNDGKTGEVLEGFIVNPQVVVVNRVFFTKPRICFDFFVSWNKKRFNIPTRQQKKRRKPVINYLPPIPPKHTLLENWWRPLLWCFFEWHLDTCKVRDQQPLVVLKQRYTSISQGYMAKIW